MPSRTSWSDPRPTRTTIRCVAFALLLVLLPVFHIFIYRPLRTLRCVGAERTSRLLSAKLAERGTEPSIAFPSPDQGRYRDAVLSDALLALASARSIGECCEFVAGHGRGLFPGSAGGVYLYGRNGSELTLAASWNAWSSESAFMRDRDCLALTLGRISWGICPHTEASGAVEGLCVPFAAGGTVLGVIAMAFDLRVEREQRESHRHLAARPCAAWTGAGCHPPAQPSVERSPRTRSGNGTVQPTWPGSGLGRELARGPGVDAIRWA